MLFAKHFLPFLFIGMLGPLSVQSVYGQEPESAPEGTAAGMEVVAPEPVAAPEAPAVEAAPAPEAPAAEAAPAPEAPAVVAAPAPEAPAAEPAPAPEAPAVEPASAPEAPAAEPAPAPEEAAGTAALPGDEPVAAPAAAEAPAVVAPAPTVMPVADGQPGLLPGQEDEGKAPSDEDFKPALLDEDDASDAEKKAPDKRGGAAPGLKIGLGDEPDNVIAEAEKDMAEFKAEAGGEAPDAAQSLPADDEAALSETIKRQAAEIEGLHDIDEGNRLMREKNYDAAIARFDAALKNLPLRPKTVDLRKNLKSQQAQCKLLQARDFYESGKFAECRAAALAALQYDPMLEEANDLRQRAERKETAQREREEKIAKDPRMSAQYAEKTKFIDDAITRGRQFMSIGENEKARTEFRKVMAKDESNPDAAYYLREIARREYKMNTKMGNATAEQMIADVREKWLTKVTPETLPRDDKGPGPTEGTAARRQMTEKLKRLTLKELAFRGASIEDVISFLSIQSVAVDTESPEGQKGVNIIMNLRRPGDQATAQAPQPQPAATDDFFGSGGAAAPATATASIAPVTMQLRDISLLDAIKHITAVTGLRYRIEENVVVITPADVVQGEVISRMYPVQANFQDLLGREDVPTTTAEGGVGGFVETTAAATPVTLGQKAKQFFERGGVPFPVGTSIDYIPQIGKLIVANTVENLDKLEQMLSELNVIPKQVEIEAKFLEIAQQDLEELGMEWLLTDNWEIAENSGSASTPLSARERIQIDKNSVTKGLRYMDYGGGTPTAVGGGTMGGILSVSSILTNPQVTMILHALEQKSGANLLSAPKVTTKSGQNAEIKVVREITYPTEYEQEAQAIGTAGVGGTTPSRVIVTPSTFEKREVGVILSASPVVDPDGYTIDLTMIPQVVELSGWIDYGYDNYNEEGVFLQHVALPQPVFTHPHHCDQHIHMGRPDGGHGRPDHGGGLEHGGQDSLTWRSSPPRILVPQQVEQQPEEEPSDICDGAPG